MQHARIDDWEEIEYQGERLAGKISEHPRQESFTAPIQFTSRLVALDLKRGVAVTQNTIYALGTPKGVAPTPKPSQTSETE